MTPNLSITVEPLENNAIVFKPMAPSSSQDKAKGRILLAFRITNHEAQQITLDTLTISFPGSTVKTEVRGIYILQDTDKDDIKEKLPVKIDSGTSLNWTFQEPGDNVVLELPAPGKIKLSITCKGFATAKDLEFPLAAHQSPVLDNAYFFPAKGKDLDVGEFWSCFGNGHSTGSQGFGYDMGVYRINHETNTYAEYYPDKTQNKHFGIWDKPVYAMADGTVLHFLNDVPNNPVPGTKANFQSFKHGHGGNHFYIQHGDEVMLYAHMQKGSLNKNLAKRDDEGNVIPVQVKAGDFLGLAGNSGNSDAPHLHIHSCQGNAPDVKAFRPIILKDMYTLSQSLVVNAPEKGFWSKVHKQGIAEGAGFVWPADSMPEWPELVELGVKESAYQDLYMAYKERGFSPVWLDAYSDMKATYFNVIFRPARVAPRAFFHGMLSGEYQEEYNKRKAAGYRLVHIESYFSHIKKAVCYAPIFEKSSAPLVKAYHGLSEESHKQKLDEFRKQGFVPVNISVVSISGRHLYTGLYEQKNPGFVEVMTAMNAAEYQEAATKNLSNGLHLVYVKTYEHSNAINFVAIWYQNIPSPYARHHLDKNEFKQELIKGRKKNLYLRGISGYLRDGVHNYAAVWNK